MSTCPNFFHLINLFLVDLFKSSASKIYMCYLCDTLLKFVLTFKFLPPSLFFPIIFLLEKHGKSQGSFANMGSH